MWGPRAGLLHLENFELVFSGEAMFGEVRTTSLSIMSYFRVRRIRDSVSYDGPLSSAGQVD